MTRQNLDNPKIYDPIIIKGMKFGVYTQGAIAATLIVSRDTNFLMFLALSSAQNVQMPAAELGLAFLITNNSSAANTITIKDADTTTTRGTIAQNAAAIVYSDGVRWWVGPLT